MAYGLQSKAVGTLLAVDEAEGPSESRAPK